jgi:hypothetical protein
MIYNTVVKSQRHGKNVEDWMIRSHFASILLDFMEVEGTTSRW